MQRNHPLRRPAHWPDNVRYITEPQYDHSVPKHILDFLRPSPDSMGPHPTPDHGPARPHPSKSIVVIQRISDPSHPARSQYGLFAMKKIPPRTLILDYVGEVHCDDRPTSDYDLSLYRTPDHVSVGVDAQYAGNEARFINDYRGVKGKPNVIFQERRTRSGELRMSVWSGSEVIKKGDELLLSYGKSWWRARHAEDPPPTCRVDVQMEQAAFSNK
ncbi:SET domain protein [Trametes punicea]|nr:SET domain protein [Trametes punicea]